MTFPALLRPLALAAPLLALLPACATAQQAYISAQTELYAGPSASYPILLTLLPGTEVRVEGCLSDYWWCDIRVSGGWRGWVYGGGLSYAWRGENLPIIQYGPSIGVPVISFIIGDYWGRYYQDRPWYQDRRYWRALPPSPPPHFGPPPRDGWRSAYPRQEHERERGWEERERERAWENRERGNPRRPEGDNPSRDDRQRAYPPRDERPAQVQPPPGGLRPPDGPSRPEREHRGDAQAAYPLRPDSDRRRDERPAQAQPPQGLPRPPDAPPRPDAGRPRDERPGQALPLQAAPRPADFPPRQEREPNRAPPPHQPAAAEPPAAPRAERPAPAAPRPPEARPAEVPHAPHREER